MMSVKSNSAFEIPRDLKPSPELLVLRDAVLAGGKIALQMRGTVQRIPKASPLDMVTAADHASQKEQIGIISQRMPGVTIIAEEQEHNGVNAETFFTLDPIDGTSIYSAGADEFGIFGGFVKEGLPYAGAILLPAKNILILAQRGSGCFMNGKRIELEKTELLKDCLVGAQFGFFVSDSIARANLELRTKCLGLRSLFSAAANVVDLLSNVTGMYVDLEGPKIWDCVASALAVEEAGGVVLDRSGNPPKWNALKMGLVYARSRALADQYLSLIGRE